MPKKGENVRRRKDGLWEGRYPCGMICDGRTKYASVYARSYAEVKEKLLTAKTKPKQLEATCKKTYSDVLLEWLEVQALSVKPSTYVKFRNLINGHISPSLGGLLLEQMSTTGITRFIQDKAERGRLDGCGGLSNSYLQSMMLILKSSLDYAVQERYMQSIAIALKYPEPVQEPVKVLTCNEQTTLELLLRGQLDASRLGILLCLYAGLRIGEICALRWGDIDFEDRLIHVRHTVQRLQTSPLAEKKTELITGPPKSKCSLRCIPIPQCLTDILLARRRNQEVYVLTETAEKPMEPRTYQYRFERYITAAGISDVNFHVLRHTFATRFIERGGDAKTLSELLGHASVEITLNKYVHPSLETKRQQMERFSAIRGMDSGNVV